MDGIEAAKLASKHPYREPTAAETRALEERLAAALGIPLEQYLAEIRSGKPIDTGSVGPDYSEDGP